MAFVTFCFDMRSLQGKLCTLGMVKSHFFPFVRRMACVAFRTIPPQMDVLQIMANQTTSTQVLILLTPMAAFARYFLMSRFKHKISLAVVKGLDWTPSGLTMANGAFFAKTPLMRLLAFMAVDTFAGRVAKFHLGLMAIRTPRSLVGALKLEIGEAVIKRFAVQSDNIQFSTFMVRMAEFALFGPDILLKSVKPLGGLQILGNFLMAHKA